LEENKKNGIKLRKVYKKYLEALKPNKENMEEIFSIIKKDVKETNRELMVEDIIKFFIKNNFYEDKQSIKIYIKNILNLYLTDLLEELKKNNIISSEFIDKFNYRKDTNKLISIVTGLMQKEKLENYLKELENNKIKNKVKELYEVKLNGKEKYFFMLNNKKELPEVLIKTLKEKLERLSKEQIKKILNKRYSLYETLQPSFLSNLYKEPLYFLKDPRFLEDELEELEENPRKNKDKIIKVKNKLARLLQDNEETRKKYINKLKAFIKENYAKFLEIEKPPKNFKGYKGGISKGIILNEIEARYEENDFDSDYKVDIEYPIVTFKNGNYRTKIYKDTNTYVPKKWTLYIKNDFNLILSNLMKGKPQQDFKKEINKNRKLLRLQKEINDMINKRIYLNNKLGFLINKISNELQEEKQIIKSNLINTKQESQYQQELKY